MPYHVCMGATLKCTMCPAPGQLVVLPVHKTLTSMKPAANIMDHMPGVNIMPFGPCMSLAFPATAAATTAALGVLTPAPCAPMTMSPWTPGSPTVILDGKPALNKSSMLACNWGGMISIQMEGQTTHEIP